MPMPILFESQETGKTFTFGYIYSGTSEIGNSPRRGQEQNNEST